MSSNETRFVYVRENKRPVTIAYRFNDEKRQIEFNSAVCGKRDLFAKKIGRAVASGRLVANVSNRAIPYELVSVDGVAPRYGLIAAELYAHFAE